MVHHYANIKKWIFLKKEFKHSKRERRKIPIQKNRIESNPKKHKTSKLKYQSNGYSYSYSYATTSVYATDNDIDVQSSVQQSHFSYIGEPFVDLS